MWKKFILIINLLVSATCYGFEPKIDFVLVKKSEKRMYLLSEGKPIKEYKVVFGPHPQGHKQKKGDERTPEGKYILDYKKKSSFYKSIHISYPNEKDKSNARHLGVNPGSAIMIHGQRNGLGWRSWLNQRFNWTDGCIAVTNKEMDEIWRLIKAGTPIEIQP
ncbi:MAG: L,D-transpeptidase family protein [Methylobacter sp.]